VKRPLEAAARFLLGYTVLVIVWGAFVRASGAGAGCGSHWPLCNGQVIPRSPGVETLIELSHRVSSGLLGILVVSFLLAAFRGYPRGHAVRKGAVWTLVFIVTESLLGAGLVKFEWVAANDSEARVYVMAFHLANTFLLLAVMTLTAWFAGGGSKLRLAGRERLGAVFAMALLAVLAVGSTGAVTALGDTLLLTEGVQPEDSPVVASLVANRFYHPTVAVVTGILLSFVAFMTSGESRRLGRALLGLYGLQLALGAVNVVLKAPVVVQLVHLAFADMIWILLIWLAATSLSTRPT